MKHSSNIGRASRRRNTALTAMALGGVLVLAGCSSPGGTGGDQTSGPSAPSGASGEPVKIGAIDSFTGAAALGGIAQQCGSKVAVAEINDAGGVLDGRPLELDYRDNQSTPAVAAQLATEMTDNGIKLFALGTTSAGLLAMLPILQDAGALSTGGVTKADEVVESGGSSIVRLNTTGSQDALPVGAYLKENAKTVVFIGSQGAYGEAAVAAIAAAMGPGVEELKRFIVPADTTDYRSVMTEIAGLDADAVVYAVSGNAQSIGLLRGFGEAKVQSQLLSPAGLLTPAIVAEAGDAADGALGATTFNPASEAPGAQRLVAAWEKYAPTVPECKDTPLDDYISLSFGQIALLAAAMDETDSDDPEVLREAIIEGEWEVPQGTAVFGEDGQVKDPEYLWVRAEGGEVTLAPDIMIG